MVLPGGGYHRHAPHEGGRVVAWLNELGLEASEFLYPVLTRHPGPTEAIRAEIRRVRDAGAERVGLVGFSAGGHAALLAAVAPDAAGGEQVDLVIAAYPVVSMMLEQHRVSRVNLIGEDASPALRAATSADLLATASAPPMFLWHTADDPVVPVQHSYLMAMALAAVGVPHALHVFPHGKHGLGLAEGSGAPARWTSLCEDWLREEKWIR